MSKCSNIPSTNYSWKQLKYFGLEILVLYRVFGHFELYKVSLYNFSVLNCFKYFLIYSFEHIFRTKKKQEKPLKFIYNFLYQNEKIYITIWSLCVAKSFSKNWFHFFFPIFWHAKIPPSSRIYTLLVLIYHLFFKYFALFKITRQNIIIRHIFLENFIKVPQVFQKIWRFSSSILTIFVTKKVISLLQKI